MLSSSLIFTLQKQRPDQIRSFQQEITGQFIELVNEHLINGVLTTFFQKPNCAICAVGSVAREEISPLSDLELVIVTNDQRRAIRLYDLIDLTAMTLLEEPKTYNPNVLSVNDRLKGLFLDKIHLFGEDYLPIGLPENLAALQKTPYTDAEYIERFSLLSHKAIFVSEPALFDAYQKQLSKIFANTEFRQAQARFVLERVVYDPQFQGDVKTDFLQPFTVAVSALYLCYNNPFERGAGIPNTLDALDALTPLFTPRSLALLKETFCDLYLARVQNDILKYKAHPREAETVEPKRLQRAHQLALKPFFEALEKLLAGGAAFDIAKYAFQVAVDKARIEPGDDLQDTVSYYTEHLIASSASFNDVLEAYRELSTFSAAEPSRATMLEFLEKARYINRQQLDTLYAIPNSDGFRQNFARARRNLMDTIEGMTLPSGEGPVIEVPGLGKRVLKSTIGIFTPTGDIKKYYADSRHNVSPIDGYNLHIKQNPDHPCMEYAIGSLMHRLFGHPMPAIELARITHGGKSYPALISQTISGKTLDKVSPKHLKTLNKRIFTEQLIGHVLTLPGDAWPRNYICGGGHLTCVDREVSLVEPIVSGYLGKTVQFTSVLFCLDVLDTLDTDALEAFRVINPEILLHNWLQDLIVYEKQCCALFPDAGENKTLLEKNPDDAFTPALLLPQGTIARLYQQILSLQSLFRDKPSPTPYDLLEHMLGNFDRAKLTSSQIGPYIRRAYEKHKAHPPEIQLKKATGKKASSSMTSSQAHRASLGRVPRADEVESRQFYAPEQALKELFVLEMQRCSESVLVTKTDDGTTVDSYFKRMTKNGAPDLERQRLILKTLSHFTDIKRLNLAGCAALTDELLADLLTAHGDKLVSLDLRYCDRITNVAPIAAAPHLEELYLSHCPGIKEVGRSAGFLTSEESVEFNTLKIFHIAHCQNLRTLRITAPNLTTIKANGNPLLTDVSPDAAVGLYTPLIQEAFGGHEWAKYFGYIGEEPPLPPDMAQQLAMPCPIWPDKTVGETHVLVLIPSHLNGKQLTLERLGEVVKVPRIADAPKSRYSSWYPNGNAKACADRNYWVLMSRDVLPESRNQSYTDQLKLVKEAAQKSGCGYRAPKLIEAAVCIFMHHVRSRDKIYPDDSRTFTRCKEKAKGESWQMVVGGFGCVSGLRVIDRNWDVDLNGLGAVREVLL